MPRTSHSTASPFARKALGAGPFWGHPPYPPHPLEAAPTLPLAARPAACPTCAVPAAAVTRAPAACCCPSSQGRPRAARRAHPCPPGSSQHTRRGTTCGAGRASRSSKAQASAGAPMLLLLLSFWQVTLGEAAEAEPVISANWMRYEEGQPVKHNRCLVAAAHGGGG